VGKVNNKIIMLIMLKGMQLFTLILKRDERILSCIVI